MAVSRGSYLFGKMDIAKNWSQENADSAPLRPEITTVDMTLAMVEILRSEDLGGKSNADQIDETYQIDVLILSYIKWIIVQTIYMEI